MFFFEENLIWQQNFTSTYLEAMELLLTLVYSTDDLQTIVASIDLHNVRVSECYQHAATYICQSQDLWKRLDHSLINRLHPWIYAHVNKTPFEICTLLSQKEVHMEFHEIAALLWGLLRRGTHCPTKMYQYAYHRCRFLTRRKSALVSACGA